MKKSITLCIFFLFIITTSLAQSKTCDCKTDLDFVVEKIKKMPSYNKQIKGDKALEFSKTYEKVSSKMQQPILIEDCYKLLLEQMLLINDVHASLSVSTEFLTKETKEDTTKIKAFKTSFLYKNHPKSTQDLSILNIELIKADLNSLEGVYKYRNTEKIGVYYAENKIDLIGVVLETDRKNWSVGEIRFHAIQTNANKYNIYYYDVETRTPGLVKSMSFENGRLWRYKKADNTFNNEYLSETIEVAKFKEINDDVQYLYFKTFGNHKKKALKAFYEDTKNRLTAKNIIVDLRTNGGGNSKFSDPFLKLLKNKNVYVITNSFTASNAEQFTLKLLKNKNAKHLGQTTFGIIAYGMNYGYRYNTPSGHFKILPTDMNFHKYIDFEGKGITPEIQLAFDKDWIAQTLDIIEADKN